MKQVIEAIKWSANEAYESLQFFLYFLGSALLLILPFFGIVWLIDVISQWYFLLMIPYFMLIPLLAKPLGKLYEPSN